MNTIVVGKAEDCPFYAYYDLGWCLYPREDETAVKPYCILYSKPSPPCPLRGGGCHVRLEDDGLTEWEGKKS